MNSTRNWLSSFRFGWSEMAVRKPRMNLRMRSEPISASYQGTFKAFFRGKKGENARLLGREGEQPLQTRKSLHVLHSKQHLLPSALQNKNCCMNGFGLVYLRTLAPFVRAS